MEKGKIKLTQKDAENTPAGGVVVGKRDGQTMIYDDASLGGYFVGKLHKDGGIKMVNKSTGQPLEVQGSEVIITAPAVNDQTKREFEGKMMTNREILSKINSDGGGVSFADGGDIPAKIHTTDCEYKLGGKVYKDTDIAHSLGMNSTLKKGKQQFSSGDTTYDVDAIYNAIKKGKLRLKTKEVETFPMKYPVYDKKYSETVKTDFRKPNGITVRTESGEEVLIDGNHRMNNAYLKGRKTMKTYYIENPKQIAKFTKKNKFELGGENKMGGHLSKGKSLKQIAEMHNVSLAHINEELAKGLEVEKEHFADFKERTRVAKDHLVENPNYYTILEKAGLKRGGHIQKQELVENSKKGDTPARDLNNYNDIMDLEADGMVGMESGLAFANGGDISKIKRYSPFPNSMDINENGDWVMYNEVKDLASFSETDKYAYVGNGRMMQSPYGDWVLYRKISYANGGITPIDANIEGDSVDILANGSALGLDPKKLQQANALLSNLGMKPINKFGENEDEVGMVYILRTNEPYQNVITPDGVTVEILVLNPNPTIRKSQLVQQTFIKNWNGKDWFMSTIKDKKSINTNVYSGKMLNDVEFKLDESTPEYLLFSDTLNVTEASFRNQIVVANAKIKEIIKNGLNLKNESITVNYNSLLGVTSNPNKTTANKVPKIEKLTITRTGALSGSNRANVIGRYASNVSELQQIVSDYIGTSPQQEYDYIVFRVNDNTRGNYYIELNKGKKNTVKNVNPETLNSLNFKRVIDAKTYLVKNYDWTDFFELGSQAPATSSKGTTHNKVKSLIFKWKESGMPSQEKVVESTEELYNLLNEAYGLNLEDISVQPLGYQLAIKPKPFLSDGIKKMVLDYSSDLAIKNINKYLYELFPDLNFDKLVRNSSTASTSAKPYELNEVVVKWNNNKETYYSGKELIEALRNIERENNGQNVVYEVIGYDYNKSGGVPVEVETDDTSFVRRNYSDQDIKSKIDNWLDGFDTDKFFSVNQATASQINTSDKEVSRVTLVYDTGTLREISCNNGSELFDAYKLIEEQAEGGSLEVKVTLNGKYNVGRFFETEGITQEVGQGGFEPSQVYSFEEFEKFVKNLFRAFNFDNFFSGSQTPTTSIKKPIVEKLYVENGASFSDIEKIRLYLDSTTVGTDEIYFYINQNGGADYIRVEMKDSLSSMYYNRNAGLEPKYKKLREIFEYNRAFENYDWEEFFSNVVSSSTANVSNLAPYEASQVTLNWENPQGISQTANFYTKGSGGSGKGFIDFLKEIEKNSNGNDVEVTIKAFAQDNYGKEIEPFTEFNIGENWFQPSKRTNEEIKLIVENDWLDGITFEKFFEDVIPLSGSQTTNLPTLSKEDLKNTKIWIGDDVELRDKVIDKLNQLGILIDSSVGNKDYKKNVFIQIYFIDFVVWDGSKTEDFDKNRFKEIFPSDLGIGLPAYQAPTTQYKPIDLSQTKIWFGKDVVLSKKIQERAFELGWYWKTFTSPTSPNYVNEPALYFHSDKDISYGNDRQRFDSNKEFREITFKDLFEKLSVSLNVQTPTVSGSFGTVKEISDFKEAVGVLEGIASQVSKKYNTENYEESLQLLNEVKDDYSTALSLTPESAFMYERIEMTKKITEVQKEIKRITELKNGGAFYILSKVIERLEKGENWKELGIGEIMVNEVPEQEIDTVIYTEKFKNWFGDWEKALVTKEYDYVSKALTESGKPCVMYHGAKRIKYSYRQVSNGVLYLAENKSYAEWFSQNNSPYQKQGDYLTQCFVDLKNPIDLTVFGVEEVDLRDIIQYIDALYPLAKIYDVLEPPVLSLEIMNNNLIGLKVRAWNIIRQYPALNTHIRENTNYDGFIYYENNPSDKIFNEQTGQLEDKITKATAVFNSNQVKLVDAMLFDGSLDDWRFETGGKIN